LDTYGLGSIVVSIAGRDKGKLLVIIGIVDEAFVLVADGDLRKVEKPKKKKLKHIKATGKCDTELGDKLRKGIVVTNAEIKKILKLHEKEN